MKTIYGLALAGILAVGMVSVPATAATTCTQVTPSSPTAVTQTGKSLLSFGARGNGTTDDSAAIQRALNSGGTIYVPSGYTFAHSQVLRITVAGTRVTGGGTFKATNQQQTSLMVLANNVTVDHITLANNVATQRWAAWEQTALLIKDVNNAVVTDVRINGASAAGLQVEHGTNFQIRRVVIQDSKSDSFHITGGSTTGTVSDVVSRRSGDDGVAVVSYKDQPISSGITVQRSVITDQRGGRGFSVVGGDNVKFDNISAYQSAAAGLYISSESEYNTHPTTNITVTNADLIESNTVRSIDHGAVVLYNSQPTTSRDVTLQNVDICNTRSSASRNIYVHKINRVTFNTVSINGGPATVIDSDVPYRNINCTVNGQPIKDWYGW